MESTLEPQLTRYSSAGEKERDEIEDDRKITKKRNTILLDRIAIASEKRLQNLQSRSIRQVDDVIWKLRPSQRVITAVSSAFSII